MIEHENEIKQLECCDDDGCPYVEVGSWKVGKDEKGDHIQGMIDGMDDHTYEQDPKKRRPNPSPLPMWNVALAIDETPLIARGVSQGSRLCNARDDTVSRLVLIERVLQHDRHLSTA